MPDRGMESERLRHLDTLVSRRENNMPFVKVKTGRRQGGPSRTGAKGAYLNRYYVIRGRGLVHRIGHYLLGNE